MSRAGDAEVTDEVKEGVALPRNGPGVPRATVNAAPVLPGSSRRRLPRVCVLALALPLLAWGLADDWRLLHEDNGALHTAFALAHVRMGLAATRGHAVFVSSTSGEQALYGHHPPGLPLLVAAAFALTGTDCPWVGRSVVIGCHAATLLLLTWLLMEVLPGQAAWAGAVLAAVAPMGAFFGRMVNYEAPGLLAVVLQLVGWVLVRRGRPRLGWGGLGGGLVVGGFLDWASFYFAAAIVVAEAARGWRGRDREALRIAAIIGGIALGTLGGVLAHLWWAGGGALAPLQEVMTRSNAGLADRGWAAIAWMTLEHVRRYLTHSGLLAMVLVGVALVRPRGRLARRLLPPAPGLRQLAVVALLAPLAYSASAPTWAAAHPYWQMYFLPAAALSGALLWNALLESRQRRPVRLVAALLVCEVLVTSAWVLHLRHTRPSEYAIRETARLRATYLAPSCRGR